ncbi:MAG: HmuY family protein [Cytophagales bacterium]
MKHSITIGVALAIFASCNEKNKNTFEPIGSNVLSIEVKDVPADVERKNKRTFFSLRENKIISSEDSNSTKWDIAFMGANIYVNGGTSGPGNAAAKIINGIFDEIKETTKDGFSTDNSPALAIPSGSGNGWYDYTGSTRTPNHVLLPIAGKVLVFRTADGKFAKLEIISYYQGNPNTGSSTFINSETRPPARYYTFRYVLQNDGSAKF